MTEEDKEEVRRLIREYMEPKHVPYAPFPVQPTKINPFPQPNPEFPDSPWTSPTWPNPWTYPTLTNATICTKCGMKWEGAMGYCCPDYGCPIQRKATC